MMVLCHQEVFVCHQHIDFFFHFFIIYGYHLNIDIFLNICPRTSAHKRNIYGDSGSPCLQPRFRRKNLDMKPFCKILVSAPFWKMCIHLLID